MEDQAFAVLLYSPRGVSLNDGDDNKSVFKIDLNATVVYRRV